MNGTKNQVRAAKRLWTSYYGASRRIPHEWARVQASNTAPKWWSEYPHLFEPELAPEWVRMAWAGKVDANDPAWEPHYRRQLQHLLESGKLAEIVDRLPKNAVLFCHEADHNTCHRKVLAEFLTANGLAEVSEFQPPRPKPVEPDLQLTLL